MSGRFMKITKIVIPMMTFIILASQLCGCAMFQPQEMVEAINQGESITIEVAEPSYEIRVAGEQSQDITWIQLDQLKTYNNGFRQGFDKAFNITIINEDGKGGKSGCLYVNTAAEREGNTTMQDAFRNKPFVTKYWSDLKIKDQLIAASGKAYSDLNGSDESLTASFNAYYNLLPDATNPDSFNATQSLSREQFYTLVYKATNPVQELTTVEGFTDAVGGETAYTKYASQVADKGFLKVANKSLDGTNISGSITRAEAIYMVVNNLFPDELTKVTGKEKSFDDIKNAGDLALKSGFKELVKVEGQKEKNLVEKDKWQAYTLAYSLQNPDKGIQEDLYKSMVVAKNLNLLGEGAESRWDESISKSEAIELLQKCFLAQNNLYGYTSEVEYGAINPNAVITDDENNIDKSDWGKTTIDPDTGIEYGLDDQGRPTSKPAKTLQEQEIESLLNRESSSSVGSAVEDNINSKGEFEYKAPETPASKPAPVTPPASSSQPAKTPPPASSSQPQKGGVIDFESPGGTIGDGKVSDDIKGGSTDKESHGVTFS